MIRLGVVGLLLGLTLIGCSPERQISSAPPTASTPADASTIESFPKAMRIASLGVNSTDGWLPLGLKADESIEVPPLSEPMRLGWYCPGRSPEHPKAYCQAPLPGESGPSVVLGHVNAGGHNGIFVKLAKVKKGAKIEIDRSDNRTFTFSVDKVQIIAKAAFPSEAVYGFSSKPVLRLVTCGPGALQTLPNGQRSYLNQTIVFASLVSVRPTKA